MSSEIDDTTTDVAKIKYSFTSDQPNLEVLYDATPPVVEFTPDRPGQYTLYYCEVDKAGNEGDVASYRFWVNSPDSLVWHFDDEGPETGFAGSGNRARNIRPAGDDAVTAGLSWWPVDGVRVMGNVVWEQFQDPLLAPEADRRGRYVTVLGRLQLQLP